MTKNNTDNPHEQSSKAREHKVGSGDTLSRIASRYKISMKNLMSLNGLSTKSVLRIGQVLKLP
jgi:LysM repeat protein